MPLTIHMIQPLVSLSMSLAIKAIAMTADIQVKKTNRICRWAMMRGFEVRAARREGGRGEGGGGVDHR